MELEPVWKHKRYSLGYFLEGFGQIRMFFDMFMIKGWRKEALSDIWVTLETMLLGQPLLYKNKEVK